MLNKFTVHNQNKITKPLTHISTSFRGLCHKMLIPNSSESGIAILNSNQTNLFASKEMLFMSHLRT